MTVDLDGSNKETTFFPLRFYHVRPSQIIFFIELGDSMAFVLDNCFYFSDPSVVIGIFSEIRVFIGKF